MTGGQYFRATDKAKLKAIYDQINQLEKSKVEVTEHVTYHEQFLLWALAGLLLLFAGVPVLESGAEKNTVKRNLQCLDSQIRNISGCCRSYPR